MPDYLKLIQDQADYFSALKQNDRPVFYLKPTDIPGYPGHY